MVASASETSAALVFELIVRFLGLLVCTDDFQELNFDATFSYTLAGGALELLACLVRPLEAFLVPEADKKREWPF